MILLSRRTFLLARLAALISVASGCGTPAPTRDPSLPVGQPISLQSNTWSWVDFPDTTCDEGTPTGLVANLSGGKDLLIFFNGGGACWDATTCLQIGTSTHGPITRANFDAGAFDFTNSILDRRLTDNPYKDWNLFFLPYCTGDLHFGNNDAVYTYNSTTKTFHHKGRANVQAYLARIAATVPNPDRVLVTGSSAGGFGAALNYALVRAYFPGAKVFLVDDSGPLLKGAAISPALRDAWANAWKFQPLLDAIDPNIQGDFSALYPALAHKFPNDRMALLSSEQDQIIRTYLGLSATDFQSALDDLDATVLSPLPHTRFFVISGQSHTMLGDPANYASAGVQLVDWLNLMQTGGDSGWSSLHP